MLGLIPATAISDNDGIKIKTVIPTRKLSLKNICVSFVFLVLVVVIELFYGKPAQQYSVSDAGISHLQSKIGNSSMSFIKFYT